MEIKEYYQLTKVVTLDVYDDMTHAIGLSKDKIKRGKYEAYRNRYIANDRPEETEKYNIAVENGIMKQYGYSDTCVAYKVTQKGLDFIAFREDCKIKEID
jgi:hypothetical protein